jgi:precorrin-6A/cobalt-precorrin-6A reductase
MLLLLAGSGEARTLAQELADAAIPAVASLAGVTRAPAALALPTRSGGFGGAQAFETYLRAHSITAILDATHPFAARMSRRSAEIAAKLGLPYLQVLRPAWQPGPGDNWTLVADEESIAAHVIPGSTVFLATGRQSLIRIGPLAARRAICRQIDRPDAPYPFADGDFMIGRPPFSVAHEAALFSRLGVNQLVVKNAGGDASATKLTAARDLGIPVLMIQRPPQPDAERVDNCAEAMAWVRGLKW